MEVAVEHDTRRLVAGPIEYGRQGGGIAIEAAGHIQGVGLQLCRLGERFSLVPVGQRAGPSRRVHELPPRGLSNCSIIKRIGRLSAQGRLSALRRHALRLVAVNGRTRYA
jgi:hypothetical protein